MSSWLFVLNGCTITNERQPARYFGPTQTMQQVIATVNANNSLIPTLHGKGSFEATIKFEGESHYVNGDILLLYGQPVSLRLVGKKVTNNVFDIGSNGDIYWVIAYPPVDKMWWGHHDRPRVADVELPISPQSLVEVLAVQSIPIDLLHEPAPVMRFNNDYDAYMIVWNELLSDRWIAHKEVWYDRKTKLPMNVLLFDENGRVVVRAYLSKYKPVEIEGAPKERGPMVATYFQLMFPDTGSKMTIDLSDHVALKFKNAPTGASFVFPGENAGISHMKSLDAKAPMTNPQ
ncbi:MAG TPA: hypothetical protein VHD56_05530 [Tepidisphaeraceae bacterium]|nr:hypothetical protein [Tepidisphaeraceae bacterium]